MDESTSRCPPPPSLCESASHEDLLARVQQLPGHLRLSPDVFKPSVADDASSMQATPVAPTMLGNSSLSDDERTFDDDLASTSSDDEPPQLFFSDDAVDTASLGDWNADDVLGQIKLSDSEDLSYSDANDSLPFSLASVAFRPDDSPVTPDLPSLLPKGVRYTIRHVRFNTRESKTVTELDIKTLKFAVSELIFYRNCPQFAGRKSNVGTKVWGLHYQCVARALRHHSGELYYDDTVKVEEYIQLENTLRDFYRVRRAPTPLVGQAPDFEDDELRENPADDYESDEHSTFFEELLISLKDKATSVKEYVCSLFDKLLNWIKPMVSPISSRIIKTFDNLRYKIVCYLVKLCDPLGTTKKFINNWRAQKLTMFTVVMIIFAILALLGIITSGFLAIVFGCKAFRFMSRRVFDPNDPYKTLPKVDQPAPLTGQAPPATIATAIGTTVAAIVDMKTKDKKCLQERLLHFSKLVAFGVAFSTFASSIFLLLPVAVQTAVSTTFATPEVKERAMIDTWLQKVNCYIRMSKIPGVVTSEEYYNWVLEASQQAIKLKDKIRTPANSQVFMRNYVELMKILTTLTQYRATNDTRRMPFSIHLSGDPGVGKTLIAPHLIRSVFDVSEREIYTRPISDEFWSGYSDQKIIFFDEFLIGDSQARSRMAAEYLELVSTKQFMPNMASVDNPTVGLKGTTACPVGVVTANNSPYSSVDGFDDAAIARRRHLVLHLHVDAEFLEKNSHSVNLAKLDYSKIAEAAWMKVCFLTPERSDTKPEMMFTLNEAICIIKSAYKKHLKICEEIERSLHTSTRPTKSPQQVLHEMLLEINNIDKEPSISESILNFISSSFETPKSFAKSFFQKDEDKETPLVGQGDEEKTLTKSQKKNIKLRERRKKKKKELAEASSSTDSNPDLSTLDTQVDSELVDERPQCTPDNPSETVKPETPTETTKPVSPKPKRPEKLMTPSRRMDVKAAKLAELVYKPKDNNGMAITPELHMNNCRKIVALHQKHQVLKAPPKDLVSAELMVCELDIVYLKAVAADYHLSQRDKLLAGALEICATRREFLKDLLAANQPKEEDPVVQPEEPPKEEPQIVQPENSSCNPAPAPTDTDHACFESAEDEYLEGDALNNVLNQKSSYPTSTKETVAIFDHSNISNQSLLHRHVCLSCGRHYVHRHKTLTVHDSYRCNACAKANASYDFDLVRSTDWLPPDSLHYRHLSEEEQAKLNQRILSFYWAYWKAKYTGPMIEVCAWGKGCFQTKNQCETHYFCHLPSSECGSGTRIGVEHTHNYGPVRTLAYLLGKVAIDFSIIIAMFTLICAVVGFFTGQFRRIMFAADLVGHSPTADRTTNAPKKTNRFTRSWNSSVYVGQGSAHKFATITLNGRSATAIPLGGRYFLTYRHGFGQQIPPRDSPMTIDYCGAIHETVFLPELCVFHEVEDLFLYYVPVSCKSLPEVKSRLNQFASQSALDRIMASQAVVIGPKTEAYVWATRVVNEKYTTNASPGLKSPKIAWVVEDGFTYDVPCSYGWCGSILQSNGNTEPGKIIGMHIAGSDPKQLSANAPIRGVAISLSKEFLQSMIDAFGNLTGQSPPIPPEEPELPIPEVVRRQMLYGTPPSRASLVGQSNDDDMRALMNARVPPVDPEETGFYGPNLIKAKRIPKGDTVYVNRLTKLKRSAISQYLDRPPTKVLPLLKADDPRNKTGKDPYFEMLQDTLSANHVPLDPKLVELAWKDTLADLSAFLVNPVDRELTFEEACSGIPGVLSSVRTNTSSGWPLCKVVRKPGKKELFWFDENGKFCYKPSFRAQVEHFVEMVRNGHKFDGTQDEARFIAYLKDEPTSPAKVEQGRCRLIYSGDVVATIGFRMLFGNILCRFNNSGDRVPATIGLNQYSYDMDTIYEFLESTDAKYLAGDFKNFDKNLNPDVAFAAYKVLQNLALPHLRGSAWESFLAHQTKSPIQAQGVLLYLKYTHMSGLFFTTILNCVAVEIMTRMAFELLMPKHVYHGHIRLKCLGDDHIIAVSHDVQMETTPADWQWAFNALGNVYTAADKSLTMPENFSDFDQITFLGATPVKFEGRWVGVAKETMLWDMLHWTRDNDNSLLQTVVTAVQLSAFYPWHEDFKWKLFNILRNNLGWSDAPGSHLYALWPHESKERLCRMVAMRTAAPHVTFFHGQAPEPTSDPTQNPPTTSNTLLDEATSSGMVMHTAQRPSVIRPSNSVSESKGQLYDGTNARVLRTTYSWPDGFVGEIAAIEVPFGLISLGSSANLQNMPFERHIYFVGVPEVQVTVQGTPFHQGLLEVFFVPLDRPSPGKENWSCMSPVRLEPAKNSTGILECPFVFTRDMMNTLIQNGSGSLGRVIIAAQSKLSSVQATPVDIIVSSSFRDADFRIPRPLATSTAEIVVLTPEQREHLPAQVIAALGSKIVVKAAQEPSSPKPDSRAKFSLATEYTTPGFTHVKGQEFVGQGNQVSYQSNSYTVSNVAGTTLDTGSLNNSTSSSPSQTVDATASLPLPFHNPPLASGALPTSHQHSSMSATSGTRPLVDMQMHPATMFLDGKKMLDNGESKIAHLLGKESILYRVSVSANSPVGTTLGDWVANSVFNGNLTNMDDVAANIAILNQFQFWRADVVYTFRLVATDYHALRLQVIAAYGTNTIGANERNVHHSAMMNFNSDCRSVSFRVPYNSTLQFLRTASRRVSLSDVISDEVHHSLSIVQMTKLLRPDTVSNICELLVYVSFDNVKVAYPLETTPFLLGRDIKPKVSMFTFGRVPATVGANFAPPILTISRSQISYNNNQFYLQPNFHMIVTFFAVGSAQPFILHVFSNTQVRRPCPQIDAISASTTQVTITLTRESADYLPPRNLVQNFALVTLKGNSTNIISDSLLVGQGEEEGLQQEEAQNAISATDSEPAPPAAPNCENTYGQHFDSCVTDLAELCRRFVYVDPFLEPFVSWKAFTSVVRSSRGISAWMNMPTCPRHPIMAFFAAWSGNTVTRVVAERPFYAFFTSSNEIVGTNTTMSYPMLSEGEGFGFNTHASDSPNLQPADYPEGGVQPIRTGALERSFQNGPDESVITVSTPFTTAYNFCACRPVSRWPAAPGSLAIEMKNNFPDIFVAGGDDFALGMYCPPPGILYQSDLSYTYGSNGFSTQA